MANNTQVINPIAIGAPGDTIRTVEKSEPRPLLFRFWRRKENRWRHSLQGQEKRMSPEEFRTHVQQAIFRDRKTRDVAFEPLEGGLERVYFWDQGVRANFLIDTNKIKSVQQLGLAVKASADQSHEAAKVQAAEEASNGPA